MNLFRVITSALIILFLSGVVISFSGCKSSQEFFAKEAGMGDTKRALIIVDVQYDFLPGGSLAVVDGDKIIPIINRLQSQFDLIVATQDWHPADHSSFVSNNPQGLWPDHAVQGSHGAELHANLSKEKIDRVFRKGIDPTVDSYSGFFDNDHLTSTGLDKYLKKQGIQEVYVVGLATDYCVKFTALDAHQLGYKTTLIVDAARGVNVKEGDVNQAIEAMRQAGVRILQSTTLLN